MRILLVEDEKNLRDVISLNLELEEWEVVSVDNGKDAIDRAVTEHYDIIILDLMIPKINGLEVLKTIRIKNHSTPVIIISAKGTSTDRIKGLKLGADDYLSKPFVIEELIIRINKLTERLQMTSDVIISDQFTFGDNKVDFKSYIAHAGDRQYELSPKEAQILKLLITNKNEVVSRQEILRSVWGYDIFPSTRTIDNFIASLRKYFEEEPKDPKFIKSVRGVGYKFVPE